MVLTLMLVAQLSLDREKDLHKDDVAQLQFEVDQLKQRAADLQSKLVRSVSQSSIQIKVATPQTS